MERKKILKYVGLVFLLIFIMEVDALVIAIAFALGWWLANNYEMKKKKSKVKKP
jgi:hypothetical protein